MASIVTMHLNKPHFIYLLLKFMDILRSSLGEDLTTQIDIFYSGMEYNTGTRTSVVSSRIALSVHQFDHLV